MIAMLEICLLCLMVTSSHGIQLQSAGVASTVHELSEQLRLVTEQFQGLKQHNEAVTHQNRLVTQRLEMVEHELQVF